MVHKTDWVSVLLGVGIIGVGLIDIIPDEPLTIPLGLGLIGHGVGYI